MLLWCIHGSKVISLTTQSNLAVCTLPNCILHSCKNWQHCKLCESVVRFTMLRWIVLWAISWNYRASVRLTPDGLHLCSSPFYNTWTFIKARILMCSCFSMYINKFDALFSTANMLILFFFHFSKYRQDLMEVSWKENKYLLIYVMKHDCLSHFRFFS